MYLSNFRKFWVQQLIHFVIGMLIAKLSHENKTAAQIGTGFVLGRQALEFLKLRDSVHIDLAWFQGGFWAFMLWWLWRRWSKARKLRQLREEQDARHAKRS